MRAMAKLRYICAIVILSVLTSCASDGSGDAVAVGWIGDPHFADMYLLPENTDGAEVSLTKFQLSQDEVNALSAGDLDMASLGYVHFLKLIEAGVDVTAVSGISTRATRVLVRDDIEASSWEDLAGLSIGIARGSTQDLQLQAAFTKNGIDPKSVNYVVFTSAADMMIALEKGAVEAVSLWEPHASSAVVKGIATDFGAIYGHAWESNSLLVARTEYLDENPEKVRAVLAGLSKGAKALTADPEHWLSTAKEYVPLDEQAIKKAIDNSGQSVKLFTQDFAVINKLMVENGYLDTPVTDEQLEQHIDLKYLRKASEQARAKVSN